MIVLPLEQQIPQIIAPYAEQRIFVHSDVITAVLPNKERAPNNACASLVTALSDRSIAAYWKS